MYNELFEKNSGQTKICGAGLRRASPIVRARLAPAPHLAACSPTLSQFLRDTCILLRIYTHTSRMNSTEEDSVRHCGRHRCSPIRGLYLHRLSSAYFPNGEHGGDSHHTASAKTTTTKAAALTRRILGDRRHTNMLYTMRAHAGELVIALRLI